LIGSRLVNARRCETLPQNPKNTKTIIVRVRKRPFYNTLVLFFHWNEYPDRFER
jgi:hypothetical protein